MFGREAFWLLDIALTTVGYTADITVDGEVISNPESLDVRLVRD
jgi:hypothetical protein